MFLRDPERSPDCSSTRIDMLIPYVRTFNGIISRAVQTNIFALIRFVNAAPRHLLDVDVLAKFSRLSSSRRGSECSTVRPASSREQLLSFAQS